MSKIFRIESVSQIHEMIGYENPKHPLISLIEGSNIKPVMSVVGLQVTSDLYSISLKNGRECGFKYGRQSYDFQEGSLIFISPNQLIEPLSAVDYEKLKDWEGWLLLFHPDLIRKSGLAKNMNEYTFFSYDSHEALHISQAEREIVTDIVKKIKIEYSQNLDEHSHELIISNIELFLNYCKRFYARQFITRSSVNKDIAVKFEEFLKGYFDSGRLEPEGLPTVKMCAEAMCYSPNYLSDLLKKETGKNTQEHIYYYLIEKAKNLLLGTREPVKSIAYSLGFDYPQHFSKLFKRKTGVSPAEYRK